MRNSCIFVSLALVISLVLAGGPGAGKARACSCAGPLALDEEFRTSDAIFAGEVVSVDEDMLSADGGPPLGSVSFDVSESWKGVSEQSAFVYGQGNGASCGIDFAKGEDYLVYAYRTGAEGSGPLETNLCKATKPLSEAETDLRLLGSRTETLPDTGGTVPIGLAGALPAMAGALLVIAGLHLVRRAKRD